MKLYNTLGHQLDEVQSLDGEQLRIYSCGPTVYDRIHIGNLSSFIFADTLHRTAAAEGLDVQHVMNFTDVDDKTIASSHDKFGDLEPLTALTKLTTKYTDLFMQDMVAIGNDNDALQFIKATESIGAMQKLITRLHENGFAYIADDGIYFSIEAYRRSGKKYGQLTEITMASTAEARIHNDEYDKQSAHDFALWKKQKSGEPGWNFELNGHNLKGRPGWHIECSAMSHATLGQPFDIHTGGVDLIFPHHENEIAQSSAGIDNPVYAKIFAHNEHLLIDGQKMSKSLHNFFTLDDVQQKGFEPLAFRLLVLQSHYRSQAHFSWDNLEAAQNRLKDLRAMAALRWQPRRVTHDAGTFALEDVPAELQRFLANDLDTPKALAFLSEISTQLLSVHLEVDMVDHFVTMLKGIDKVLGLRLSEVADISAEQKNLLNEREQARAEQNWARSDAIRQQLQAQGVGVHDATHGVIWYPL
jgi:cysteinyl-tRNA synthetase